MVSWALQSKDVEKLAEKMAATLQERKALRSGEQEKKGEHSWRRSWVLSLLIYRSIGLFGFSRFGSRAKKIMSIKEKLTIVARYAWIQLFLWWTFFTHPVRVALQKLISPNSTPTPIGWCSRCAQTNVTTLLTFSAVVV